MRIMVLAIDGLDFNLVERFGCKNLMQSCHGKTDISNFDLAKTVILWASFLTGRNMQEDAKNKNLWNFKVSEEETFLKLFRYKSIDVPAFNFKQENHKKERQALKCFFDEKSSIEEYDAIAWKNHEENKKEFFDLLNRKQTYEVIIVYFNLADIIGHLSFGIEEKMKKVYLELDAIAGEVKKSWEGAILIISDHGMKAIGRYGDHTKNGFWSLNKDVKLDMPKITDFSNLMIKFKKSN